MRKVVKFGGSSLANAEQFEKVGDIIRSEESRRFVVPSAPGKRFDGDTKVTDLLYSCYDAAANGGDFEKVLEEIKSRYYEIIKGLGLALSMEEDFQLIKENFKAQIGRDYAASRGEYLNGKVMAAYLGYEFVDAAEVIRFDKNGNLEQGYGGERRCRSLCCYEGQSSPDERRGQPGRKPVGILLRTDAAGVPQG